MTTKKRITFGRRRKRKNPARMLLRELPNFLKLVFRLVRDPRVPGIHKALFGAVAVYMLTPADLIPDFLGVLGWVDDLFLLGLALSRLMASAGPNALLRHWDGNPAALGYLVEGVEEMGGMLPQKVQSALRGLAKDPSRLGRKRRRAPVRRIRVDEDARLHVEE
ncbi:MAG TPA: YkvA family protein [Longimicrobiales bacterium]|nr:YkvA family protein [Longimicrobiales bacterium]